MIGQEAKLVEARLERSQAEAKAQRAQQRLDDFLAEQPAAQVLLVLVQFRPDLVHVHANQHCSMHSTDSMHSRVLHRSLSIPWHKLQ